MRSARIAAAGESGIFMALFHRLDAGAEEPVEGIRQARIPAGHPRIAAQLAEARRGERRPRRLRGEAEVAPAGSKRAVDGGKLLRHELAAEGDVDRALGDRDARGVRAQRHHVARPAQRARGPRRGIDGIGALDVARDALRERAGAGADLHEDLAQAERAAQQAEVALQLARAARVLGQLALDDVALAERFLYQHIPSYTPRMVRELHTRTKSMTVWPSMTRLGTSANSGAALPMTMVCAWSSTSCTVGTIRREMCGMRFRM